MRILFTYEPQAKQALPEEAFVWLEACHLGIRQSYKSCFEVASEDTIVSFDMFKAAKEGCHKDFIQSFLEKNLLTSCILLDGLYPFVCPHDLNCLFQKIKSDNAIAFLRTHRKKIIGIGLSKNSKEVVYVDLPEFRSVRVSSVTSWQIARQVQKDWPLFYFNGGYFDYWQQIATGENTEHNEIPTEDAFIYFFNNASLHATIDNKKLLDAGCGHGRFFFII